MIRREFGLSDPVLRSLISVCTEVPASAESRTWEPRPTAVPTTA